MLSSKTLPTLGRIVVSHVLLFAMIQVALSVSRIYSVLPGFRLVGIMTSVPGPETAFSCCIVCARDSANCDASHFNTLTGACELVEYDADPLSIEAAPEWVLYYNSSIHLSLTFDANASQSSDRGPLPGGFANLAIDGDRSSDFFEGSCTCTSYEDLSPWWQVDLTARMHVYGVLMWNRHDMSPEYARRMSNLTVYVSPTFEGLGDANYVCGTFPGPPDPLYSNPIEVTCARIMAGRYIMIHKTHYSMLHLCEVELILL